MQFQIIPHVEKSLSIAPAHWIETRSHTNFVSTIQATPSRWQKLQLDGPPIAPREDAV